MCQCSRCPESIVTASAATARANHAHPIQPMRLTSHTSTDPVMSGVTNRCRTWAHDRPEGTSGAPAATSPAGKPAITTSSATRAPIRRITVMGVLPVPQAEHGPAHARSPG